MTTSLFRFLLLSIFLVAFGQNGRSATAYPSVPVEAEAQVVFSKNKKGKKRARFWKKWKVKFAEAKPDKRSSKYGKTAWLVLIAGFVFILITPGLFVLGYCFSLLFSLLGIFHDEKKDTAVTALVMLLLLALIGLVALIAIGRAAD